jgi:hypothetical protein
VLQYHHKSSDPRFRDILDSFRGDDEYGLLFTQTSFLNEGGDALRNRGLTRPTLPALADLLHRFKEAEKRKAQEQIAAPGASSASKLKGDPAEKQIAVACNELCNRMENSVDVQTAFSAGVRQRRIQAGYSPRSVLFELFQNADDAYVEGNRLAETGARFGVVVSADWVTVSHDGRPINRQGPDDAYDLRKMVALHHSDKGEDGREVTGKFGLGFKSVFLVCDEPRIVSGRLAVRIVVGSYPLALSADAGKKLRQRLPTETSTLFYLPTREVTGACPAVTAWRGCSRGSTAGATPPRCRR